MKLSELKVNVKQINDGVWKDVPGDDDGMRMLVRGTRSKAYTKAYDRMLAKFGRMYGRNQERFTAALKDIEPKLLAEHCLLGWEKFYDEAGAEVPFTPELAMSLMTDENYPMFQELVRELVKDVDYGYSVSEDDTVEKS